MKSSGRNRQDRLCRRGDVEAAAKFKAVFEASWIEQGVYDVAALAAYLALPEVAYDPVNGYQKLMTEKWWLLFEWMGSLNDWM